MIGDEAVRHRGTIGGSIANNDPAADYPAAALALGATIKTNKRSIKADDFFTGMFSTALEQDELITEVEFPVPEKAGVREVPQSGLALCDRRRVRGEVSGRRARRGDRRGAGRRVPPDGDGDRRCRRIFLPMRWRASRRRRTGMNGDIHASAEYRAHLVGVIAKRAVAKAA